MSKRRVSSEMVTKSKNRVLSCSTPEHHAESPSRDSDSVCDSEAASPVPFLCTQDGAEGETDVVWDFYTPKSNAAKSRHKNSTPLSRKSKRSLRPKLIEKPLPKRRNIRPSQKKTELFLELQELNRNIHELIDKTAKSRPVAEKPQLGSEEDIFSDTNECSPKTGFKMNSRCLRKNVLSSKFSKIELEAGLESDDSMNECLLKASQIVEENILCPAEKPRKDVETKKSRSEFRTSHDSMDAILSSMKLGSPHIKQIKKCESPGLNNDSFDNLVGNLNDSALERLTQMPIKNDISPKKNDCSKESTNWKIKELLVHEGSSSSRSIFTRHSSMPESPTVNINQPSTSGMVFGRYNSLPFDNSDEKISVLGDSPIRCTPEEIKKKHLQAREKLLAKRLLPFTQQSSQLTQADHPSEPKKTKFQPKFASTTSNVTQTKLNDSKQKANTSNSVEMKQLIEKKRREALMKLRRKQPHNK